MRRTIIAAALVSTSALATMPAMLPEPVVTKDRVAALFVGTSLWTIRSSISSR